MIAQRTSLLQAASSGMSSHGLYVVENRYLHLQGKPTDSQSHDCRMERQEKARGFCCYETEFWVETALVQRAKRVTKFRTTNSPELLLLGSLLFDEALLRLLHSSPEELRKEESRIRTLGSNRPGLAGSITDHADMGEDMLLGSGKRCADESAEHCQSLLSHLLSEMESLGDQWDVCSLPDYEYYSYSRLALRGFEIVHTTAYNLPRSRVSHYCRVRYVEADNREVVYVAKLKSAVKVIDPNNAFSLRFAVCDLYTANAREFPEGTQLSVPAQSSPSFTDYPVLLSSLDCKLLFCNLTRSAAASAHHRVQQWLFIPYSNVQAAVDPDQLDF